MNERFTAPETSVDPNAPTVSESHSLGEHRVTTGLVLGGRHPLTLCGLSQVLGREEGFTVLAVATTHEAILEEVRRHRPRVVILDLDQNATFKLLRRLQRHDVSTRIVVLTSASEYNEMADALLMGAHAVVKKEVSADAVVACIRRVCDSMQRLDDGTAHRFVGRLFNAGTMLRSATRQLTPRETEIARMAALGVSTREIADRLAVKRGTVKIHLHSIYDKLSVGGRLGLIRFAHRHGLP
jgi:two-component system, NarL family, nitrate/nitrite response regulator NarL